LVVEVVSPLVAQYSGVTATILVYVSAEPDCQFFELGGGLLSTITTNIISAGKVGEVMNSGTSKVIPCEMGDGVNEPSPEMSLITFGEEMKSFRSLLKRFSFINTWTPYSQTSPGTITAGSLLCMAMNIDPPCHLPVTALTVATGAFGYGSAVGSQWPMTPFMWLRSCFLGMRGSSKYTFFVNNPVIVTDTQFTLPTAYTWVARTARAASDINFAALAFGSTYNVTSPLTFNTFQVEGSTPGNYPLNSYSGAEACIADKTALVYSVPDNSNSLFRYSAVQIDGTTAGNNGTLECGAVQYHAVYHQVFAKGTGVAPISNVTVMHAVGDDFSFVHYYGPPLIDFGAIS